MKRNNAWKPGLSVVLALALLLGAVMAASAEGTFSFRNGITWDTTLEELKAAEELTDETTYEEMIYEGSGYLFITDGEGEDAVSIGYMFYENEIAMIMEQFMAEDLSAAFAAGKAALTAEYGEQTMSDPTEATAILSLIDEELMEEANLADFAGWMLDDGTQIYLINADGDVGALYINAEHFMTMMTMMMASGEE